MAMSAAVVYPINQYDTRALPRDPREIGLLVKNFSKVGPSLVRRLITPPTMGGYVTSSSDTTVTLTPEFILN